MPLQLPKGTRDLKPEEAIVRNKIVDTLRNTFKIYGYSPLETPAFERYDILASKYAGGNEILKETFKFNDQGKRELGLRYDLTVPMCRFIAMNPIIKLPFKRYAIGEVFRDGPVEKSRYREFTQCDVDVVGIKGMQADAEIIALIQRAFKKLGFDVVVKVNNRKLLNELLINAGVKNEKLEAATKRIEKSYIICEFLKKASEKDLDYIMYTIQGKVFPISDDRKTTFAHSGTHRWSSYLSW